MGSNPISGSIRDANGLKFQTKKKDISECQKKSLTGRSRT